MGIMGLAVKACRARVSLCLKFVPLIKIAMSAIKVAVSVRVRVRSVRIRVATWCLKGFVLACRKSWATRTRR